MRHPKLATTTLSAALGAVLCLAVPGIGAAQSIPSYGAPVARQEYITGTLTGFNGSYVVYMRDDKGYDDNITMHDGTVINPTGIKLVEGMRVAIWGNANGSTFNANTIQVVGQADYAGGAGYNGGYYPGGYYPNGYGYGYGYGGYGYPYYGYPYGVGIGIGFGWGGWGWGGPWGYGWWRPWGWYGYRGYCCGYRYPYGYYGGYRYPYGYRGPGGYYRGPGGYGGYHGTISAPHGGGGAPVSHGSVSGGRPPHH